MDQELGAGQVDERRAMESPVAHLRGVNVKIDRRHDRRVLEPDELRRLLECTHNGPTRFGMTGPERAVLYRVAAESGLRANELRSLKVSSFDFNRCNVTVGAVVSKHREQDEIPLRADTITLVKNLLSGKMPQA